MAPKDRFKRPSRKNKKLEMSPVLTPEQIDDQLYTKCSKNLPLAETEIPKNIMEELYLATDPEKVRAVGEAINYLAEQDYEVLGFLFKQMKKFDDIAKLFVQRPDKYVEIREAFGTYSEEVFRTLTHPGIWDLFLQKPDVVIEKFAKFADAAGMVEVKGRVWEEDVGMAFQALENTPEVANFFIEKPGVLAKKLLELNDVSGFAVLALSGPGIGKLFGQKPDVVIKNFKKIADATKKMWPEIGPNNEHDSFNSLMHSNVAKLFVKHPDKFGEIADNAGFNTAQVFGVLMDHPEVGKLFAKHPDKFVELTRYKNHAYDVFKTLAHPDIGKLFAKNPDVVIKSFGEIIKNTAEGERFVFRALREPKIGKLFAKNPDKFVEIARAARRAGKHVWVAFEQVK